MADGSSGGISGVLFEAGKTISDAGKKQAQATANAVGGQLGAQKPLFGGQKPQTTGPGGFLPQKPKLDPFGDFGKMFEGGKPGFGAKKPPLPPTPQFSQADLDAMAAQNKVVDDQEIAKRQAELEQIKVAKHKGLHDEVYYNAIKNVGENSLAQSRKEKAEQEEQVEAQKQQNQQAGQLPDLPAPMAGNNPQFDKPESVKQAQTTTEAHRGTTG